MAKLMYSASVQQELLQGITSRILSLSSIQNTSMSLMSLQMVRWLAPMNSSTYASKAGTPPWILQIMTLLGLLKLPIGGMLMEAISLLTCLWSGIRLPLGTDNEEKDEKVSKQKYLLIKTNSSNLKLRSRQCTVFNNNTNSCDDKWVTKDWWESRNKGNTEKQVTDEYKIKVKLNTVRDKYMILAKTGLSI